MVNVGRIKEHMKTALLLFSVATFFGILIFVIAEYLEGIEESYLAQTVGSIARKIADAFTFVAAASLTGAVYLWIAEYREAGRAIEALEKEIFCNGNAYELRQFYVKK